MKEKIAQHYVPQTYLKKFYNTNDSFWVLDLAKLSNGYKDYLQQKKSGQICHDKYYYDLDQDFKDKNPEYAILDKQHIENETFKRLENEYGKVLYTAITERYELTSSECESFSEFIVQMKIRNPHYRNNDLKNNGTRLIDIAKEQLKFDAYYNERFKSIPNNIKEYLLELTMDKKYNGKNFERNLQLASIIKREEDHMKNTILKDAIKKHPWYIAHCDVLGASFLTTDNPGASVSKIKPGIFNTKFNEDFTFYFPISPKHCIVIDGTQIDVDFFYDPTLKKIANKNVSLEETMRINNIIIQKQNKLIISRDKHILMEIAKNNVGRRHQQ